MTDKFNFDDTEYGQQYETVARQAIFGYEQLFPMTLGYFAAGLGDQARVLVVGAGTGQELVTFGLHQPGWRLTGVDPSAQMIGIARNAVQWHGLTERVALVQGYTQDLPLDEIFEAATLILVMQFLPDDGAKLALLQSIARRLKTGAQLALVDMHGDPPSARFKQILAAWKSYLIYQGMPPEMIPALLEKGVGSLHLISEARTQALLSEADFTDIRRFYKAHLYGGWLARCRSFA